MGYPLEINGLLRLPSDFNYGSLKEGEDYTIVKDGQRLYPINIPLEFCNQDYKYLGKAVISNLEMNKKTTKLTFSAAKIFNEKESQIFSDNFIKPKN